MADPVVTITNGVPTGGTGTITTLGQIVDPTNGPAAIKAASTAPVATDKALVVAVSPNTPTLPVSGTVTANATLAAETTKVIGVVRNVGNAGAVLDFAGQNAAAPANSLLVGAEFNTTPTTLTSGNASPLQMDSAGNLLVNIKAGAAAGGTSSTVGSAAPSTATAAGFTDGTNMVLAKVKAASSGAAAATDPALVVTLRDVNANGQTTMSASAPVVIASDQSVLTTQLASSSNIVSGAITTAMTGTTTTSLVAAPGASLRNYITTIIVSNAHATVGTDVIIQDGSGGTTLLTIPAAALYGGGVISLPVPLRQPTTNTALFCANVTTGASTKVSAVGFKGA